MRVLVVEDDFLVAFEVDDALNEAGHVVELAPTADRAFAFLADHGADLAVVDVALGDRTLDCKGFARRLHDEFGIRTMFVNGQIRASRGRIPAMPHMFGQPFAPNELRTAVGFAERVIRGDSAIPSDWLGFDDPWRRAD